MLKILLESGRLTHDNLNWILLRKTDWHDLDGVKMVLEQGADPNAMTRFGDNAVHHAIRRDNRIEIVQTLLDAGADPLLCGRDGRSAAVMAAHRGRADVLALLSQGNVPMDFHGVDRLIAACAMGDDDTIRALMASEPDVRTALIECGGTLLAEFAGVGNTAGVRRLLDCGVSPSAIYREGDSYYDIANDSTALHVAAWRGWPQVVKELIAHGTPVDALDGRGRRAIELAVKACVDSHWTWRRSPDSVEALLEAGASPRGIDIPTGYVDIDVLLRTAST